MTSRTGLNSTLRKDGAAGDKPPGGLSRAGSSSRLGLQSNAGGERPSLNRAGSSSRLGLSAPGARAGSNTRQGLRGVNRDEKTPVKDPNSTLNRTIASRAGGRTPA